MGGASCPRLAWLEGEGAEGQGSSDAISSQGTVKVAVLPGGPGCLQRSPASLVASCHPPGLPVLGTSCWEPAAWSPASLSLSLFLSPSSLFFSHPLAFLSLLSLRLSPVPPFAPSYHHLSFSLLSFHYFFHSFSLYLFLWSLSFFPFFFFSLPLSFFRMWIFLCLALYSESATAQGQERPP